MRKLVLILGAMLLASGAAVGQEVQLDISDGFNWDIWCGVREYQALMMHDVVDMGIDLVEMQGNYAEHNGPQYLLGNASWLICEIDAELAEEMGCIQDASLAYMGYAGPTTWNRPQYKSST
ncbi:MAG: hypothetical protein JXL80_17015, partial [Planctomycetes bacterium]|nr:hypothetical protein [Planctomycetota bacterium]